MNEINISSITKGTAHIRGNDSKTFSAEENLNDFFNKIKNVLVKESPSKEAGDIFSERDKMVLSIYNSHLQVADLIEQQNRLHQQIGAEDLDTRIQEEQKKIGASDELLKIMSNKDAFLNQLSVTDSQTYGALSALAYSEFVKENLEKIPQRTETDLAVVSYHRALENLNVYGEKLNKIISNTAPSKIKSEIDAFVKGLDEVFGIKLSNYTQDDIVVAIEKKKQEIQNNIAHFKNQAAIEQTEEIKRLQQLLQQNRFAKHLEVQGIFYRNNGEFSGFAAYDREKHQLSIVFAGSKSTGDWMKNFMGWNAKASSRRGLLTNMNLHAGFLSHLEDLSDETFEAAYRIIKNLSNQKQAKKLDIVGTGHSLGGALATLFTASAKEMAVSMGIDVNARGCTFGAPNMVHSGSVDKMNELFGGAGNWVRFENSLDPVPVACFWKDNPGVSIRYNAEFFYDKAHALQIFGQNPHGSENYYHSIETHMDEWKKSTQQLLELVSKKEAMKQKSAELKAKADALLAEIQKNMIAIIDFDQKNNTQLAQTRNWHLAQLETQVNGSKKALEKALSDVESLEFSENELTTSTIASFASNFKKAKELAKLTQFIYEDAQKADQAKTEKKKSRKAMKELKALLS
jgi:hypothetical protein